MYDIVLFCKTYRGDLNVLLRLANSINNHNKDNIPVYISVPKSDYNLFKDKLNNYNINLITDESVCTELAKKNVRNWTPGYINQQIVKITFWKAGYSENYLCLDSDAYFIRDFYISDFMYDDQTPYSVLYEWEEHFLDKGYLNWVDIHKENIDKIKDKIKLKTSKYITCCGLAILSKKVLESFEKNYLVPNNLSYIDIISYAPFEFSWYNQWLLKDRTIPIMPIGQLFKIFHYRKQYVQTRKKLINEADISIMYIGVVLNSNWSPIPAPERYKNCSKFQILISTFKISLFGRIANKLFVIAYNVLRKVWTTI